MVAQFIGYSNGDARNADGQALGVKLRAEAAGALDALAFYFDKEFDKPPPALEGMRGIDRQNYYWDRYVNRRPGWTVAAVPGTSNHGWGLAVDFGSPINSSLSREHRWLAAHAPLFGWDWTGRNFGEPWHFDYTGVNVTAQQRAEYIQRGTGSVPAKHAAPPKPTTPTIVQEDTMLIIFEETDMLKRIFAFSGGATHLVDQAFVTLVKGVNEEIGLPTKHVKRGTYEIARLSEIARNANGSNLVMDEIRKLTKAIEAVNKRLDERKS